MSIILKTIPHSGCDCSDLVTNWDIESWRGLGIRCPSLYMSQASEVGFMWVTLVPKPDLTARPLCSTLSPKDPTHNELSASVFWMEGSDRSGQIPRYPTRTQMALPQAHKAPQDKTWEGVSEYGVKCSFCPAQPWEWTCH